MPNLRIITPDFKSFKKFIDKQKKRRKSNGVEIGVIKNATGLNKRTGGPKKISVAEEAFYNCKGVPEKNIPPRDYQQRTISKNMKKWQAEIKKLLKKNSNNQTLDIMGIIARDATKDNIAHFGSPKNAPSTIRIKGKDTPLVDFGDLLKSITYKIIGGIKK